VNVPVVVGERPARDLPKPAWLVLPIGVWTALLLAVVAAVVLNRTVFGAGLRAGSNEPRQRACGVDTGRLRIAIYGIAGCLFGLTG
jgi:ribose/xylose/arabinose/galactoside ABC-type transport system permease subunit